jgi:hypothetical protein
VFSVRLTVMLSEDLTQGADVRPRASSQRENTFRRPCKRMHADEAGNATVRAAPVSRRGQRGIFTQHITQNTGVNSLRSDLS